MKKHLLVVAALLLTVLSGMGWAHAAETPEHPSKNARKLLVVLSALGINSQEVRDAVGRIDRRSDDRYLYLSKEQLGDGALSVRYRLKDGASIGNLQLHYKPAPDSRFDYTAERSGIMMNYTLRY